MYIEKLVIKALEDIDCPLQSALNPNGIIPVISDLNQPEPRSPYLLIGIISTRKIGFPYKSIIHDQDTVKEFVFQVKDYLIDLTLHTKNTDTSQEWFRHFENGIHSDMVDWAFTKQGLSLVSATDIIYQTEPSSGVAYKRAIMNLSLRTEVQESYDVNYLNRVNIEGSIGDKNGDYIGNIVVDKHKP